MPGNNKASHLSSWEAGEYSMYGDPQPNHYCRVSVIEFKHQRRYYLTN